jgi:hypothetical protein
MFFTMNKQDQYDEDLLRKFINPERIEKAPEGFTSKTLTRIQIENQSEKVKNGFFAKNRVPLISAIITIGLTTAAIMVPANETGSVGSAIWKYFQSIEFTLPGINNTYFQNLNIPSWISFAIIGIFLLGFFDRALYGIFHKERK